MKQIDKIIRSKRRTIALVITKDATLEVRAPLRAPLELIKQFVAKKRSWIEKKIDLMSKRRKRILPKEFVDGEEFMYEGNIFKLQAGDCKEISMFDVLYFPRKFLPQAKRHLTIWYKNRALEKIVERVKHYASITQLQYKSIKITNAKRRWGSCSAKGSLNISWRLIMARPDILDYVVVHELVHLVEMNHSRSFWNKVQKILPDYKRHRDWLKQNGDSLVL
jgi:predicted metal-dependent hydrolase